MLSYWTQGYKDKEQRRKQVKGYQNAFDDLKQILEQHYKKKEAVRDYDAPNWEYRQIAHNEYNQVLADVMKLLDVKE